jgi:hypothetical protein
VHVFSASWQQFFRSVIDRIENRLCVSCTVDRVAVGGVFHSSDALAVFVGVRKVDFHAQPVRVDYDRIYGK